MTIKARYPWIRYWVPLGGPSGVATRGLFSREAHSMSATNRGSLEAHSLRELDHIRVLLLQGASQSGKSVAFEQDAARLRHHGHSVVELDFAVNPGSLLNNSELSSGRQSVTVFVDNFDIALLEHKMAQSDMIAALETIRKNTGARVRIAMRSGYTAERLIRHCREFFESEFQERVIAPLRPEDVRLAAAAENLVPEDFLRAIEALQAGPMAAQPLTLRWLLKVRIDNGRLPRRLTDLYRQGCEALATETSLTRREALGGDNAQFVGNVSVAERLAIASRIACLMVLSDCEVVDCTAEPSAGTLPLEQLLGGVEATIRGEVVVNRANVREVLRTSLFRVETTDCFAFTHPSLLTFMGAEFLQRKASPSQILSLLLLSNGRVAANRISVASWLGALEEQFAEVLIRRDPQVLLRCGVPLPTPTKRAALADALLTESGQDALDLKKELKQSGNLVLITFPELKAKLATVLADNSQSDSVRLFACWIARDAAKAPIEALLALAADDQASLSLRMGALSALREVPFLPRQAIIALACRDDPTDPKGNISTSAQDLALHNALSPADIIGLIRPESEPLSLPASLCLRLIRDTSIAELPRALKAIARIANNPSKKDGDIRNFVLIASGLGRRAFAYLDNQSVRESLATLIEAIPRDSNWITWSDTLQIRGMPPQATSALRRSLVEEVVAQSSKLEVVETLLETPYLLLDEDATWIEECAFQQSGTPQAAIWSTLLVEIIIGFGGVPIRYLAREGLDWSALNVVLSQVKNLSNPFERWRPRDQQTIDDQDWEELTDSDLDEAVEPENLIKTYDDYQLLQVQVEAGGRADAAAVPPEVLLALMEQSERRLVLNDRDLLVVVQESLGRLEKRLKRRDPVVRALWNEEKNWGDPKASEFNGANPKNENFLSDFVVDHLRQDLVGRGLVADREVGIRERLAQTKGQRTDIQIQAFRLRAPNTPAVASLTIEVKGCWHDEVYTAMKTQLVDQYLSTTGERVGLYLVGWYVCSSWCKSNVGGSKARPSQYPVFTERLKKQAAQISELGRVYVETFVLDATLT